DPPPLRDRIHRQARHGLPARHGRMAGNSAAPDLAAVEAAPLRVPADPAGPNEVRAGQDMPALLRIAHRDASQLRAFPASHAALQRQPNTDNRTETTEHRQDNRTQTRQPNRCRQRKVDESTVITRGCNAEYGPLPEAETL